MNDKIIIALDTEGFPEMEKVIVGTKDHPIVHGYKISSSLVIEYGLIHLVNKIKDHTDKVLIYDHQKGGTDTPHTGKAFVKVCKRSGINSVILFPFTGPATAKAWIEACKEEGLNVILGGKMTHPEFEYDEGGFIHEIEKMYHLGSNLDITHYVLPGNQPEYVDHILEHHLLFIDDKPHTFYLPGFKTQGGSLETMSKILKGHLWYPIIGRDIINLGFKDMDTRLDEYQKELS